MPRSKYKQYNVPDLLGFTPIARVSDALIWSRMVTPMVRAILGDVVSVDGPHVLETVQGLFPGDEATNLNDHRMYGGLSSNVVRFPYVEVIYRTKFGALVIKKDAVKIKVLGWFGNIDSGKAQMIYEGALRDRRFDGTRRADDTALLKFTYADKDLNRPLPWGKAVELSIYGFLPGTRVVDLLGEGEAEYQRFIASPFSFVNDPDKFLKHFERAWHGSLAPGQIAPTFPDISKFVPSNFAAVAKKAGYDYIENASSHYHVAMWATSVGYRYTFKHDAETLAALANGIKQLKAKGTKLTRPQESWVCVVQSLRPIDRIPTELYIGGAEWPQNNIDAKNLWMNTPLNEQAKAKLPEALTA